VKFLAIFSSNLDEFFEIRVSGIKQQIASGNTVTGPDGISPSEQFQRIQKRVHELVAMQYGLWNEEILPRLAKERIRLREVSSLKGAEREWAYRYFRDEIFPVLTPLAVDASHPFPRIANKSHNFLVRLRRPDTTEDDAELLYSIVQVPRVAPRLLAMPRKEGKSWDYLLLSNLIREFLGDLFPGLVIDGAHAFRITRNSDLYIDDEEAENLLRTIEQGLRRANRGNAVRLEVKKDCPRDFETYLLERFQLTDADLYHLDGPISMPHLMPLLDNDALAHLKDRPFLAASDALLPQGDEAWECLRKGDVLLHHPYDSFDEVVDFITHAAVDPKVLAIKMTLYRTSGNSPIVAALGKAAMKGKQVTAIIELKARFDEANNIHWARQLEEYGAHVVYGVVGLKTHCKMLLVVRRDEDRIRHYVHLGTGNYHPRTAKIYTDLSLFTSRPELTQEVATLFNTLTGLAGYPGFKKLLVSPFDLAARFKGLIERERDHALAGRPARIIVKLNSLVDETLITALYEASCAGVKIDLIVRGICCLRPQVPGVSENIRVISIVGRFLEHSRIYSFANGGTPEVYLGSADWMPRNLYRRVEVAFPLEDTRLRDFVQNEMLPAFLNDEVKARELQADGSYLRLKPKQTGKPAQAQLYFRKRSREFQAALAARSGGPAKRLVPITKPESKND